MIPFQTLAVPSHAVMETVQVRETLKSRKEKKRRNLNHPPLSPKGAANVIPALKILQHFQFARFSIAKQGPKTQSPALLLIKAAVPTFSREALRLIYTMLDRILNIMVRAQTRITSKHDQLRPQSIVWKSPVTTLTPAIVYTTSMCLWIWYCNKIKGSLD